MSNSLFTEAAIFKKTPQELTALLYEACITHLEDSIDYINSKDLILANQKLQNANDIIWRLGAGLNYEAGIIADQLDLLYNYIAEKLIEANLNKDIIIIQEVISILEELLTAWNQGLKNKPKPLNTGLHRKTQAYERNIFIDN